MARIDSRIPSWNSVSFEGSEDTQILLNLAASPAQRLDWLEAALAMAERSGALEADRSESVLESSIAGVSKECGPTPPR